MGMLEVSKNLLALVNPSLIHKPPGTDSGSTAGEISAVLRRHANALAEEGEAAPAKGTPAYLNYLLSVRYQQLLDNPEDTETVGKGGDVGEGFTQLPQGTTAGAMDVGQRVAAHGKPQSPEEGVAHAGESSSERSGTWVSRGAFSIEKTAIERNAAKYSLKEGGALAKQLVGAKGSEASVIVSRNIKMAGGIGMGGTVCLWSGDSVIVDAPRDQQGAVGLTKDFLAMVGVRTGPRRVVWGAVLWGTEGAQWKEDTHTRLTLDTRSLPGTDSVHSEKLDSWIAENLVLGDKSEVAPSLVRGDRRRALAETATAAAAAAAPATGATSKRKAAGSAQPKAATEPAPAAKRQKRLPPSRNAPVACANGNAKSRARAPKLTTGAAAGLS